MNEYKILEINQNKKTLLKQNTLELVIERIENEKMAR